MGRISLLLSAPLMFASLPARAQVIEIDDEGTSHTYDARHQPTLFAPAKNRFDLEVSLTRAARQYQVDPGLLRAVAWQESRGNRSAVSPKGALGIMQLMPGTAALLGVDPRDPEANIRGGAAYLSRQLAAFGSVPLALAAYNAGPGAVQKYGGIPPYAETRGYVATIMRRLSTVPVVTAAVSSRSERRNASGFCVARICTICSTRPCRFGCDRRGSRMAARHLAR